MLSHSYYLILQLYQHHLQLITILFNNDTKIKRKIKFYKFRRIYIFILNISRIYCKMTLQELGHIKYFLCNIIMLHLNPINLLTNNLLINKKLKHQILVLHFLYFFHFLQLIFFILMAFLSILHHQITDVMKYFKIFVYSKSHLFILFCFLSQKSHFQLQPLFAHQLVCFFTIIFFFLYFFI